MLSIRFEQAKSLKAKPEDDKLGFGKYFTDYMFMMNYSVDKGWYDPRIVPYGPLVLDPACVVFHYAQEMFEGLKAYRVADEHTSVGGCTLDGTSEQTVAHDKMPLLISVDARHES